MKDKPLSEKMHWENINGEHGYYCFYEEDVREAVKKLKEEFCLDDFCDRHTIPQCNNCLKIDKIFGEELSK